MRKIVARLLNPVVLTFSGRRGTYAIVRHVGRRSGRSYSTPVVAARLGDSFVIPLPYGPDVDWVRNVRAAGQFTLQRGAVAYTVAAPEVIEQTAALPAFAAPARLAIRLLGIRQFLKLRGAPGRTSDWTDESRPGARSIPLDAHGAIRGKRTL